MELTDVKVQKIFEEYENVFKEMQTAAASGQKVTRDLWIYERKFVQACTFIKELQITLGVQVYKL